MDAFEVERAHKHSFKSRDELERSSVAGCLYCLATYPPASIVQWTDDDQTALCPECGIDSVIGDAAGFTLTREFLRAMHERWFGMS